ncbi:MAG: glycosyltransferase [Hydrogenophaga sp.]|nr:glycosyltransferase [Hydrogenophaga sp.]
MLSWSLLEALASGCAVVASDTAPVRGVIRCGENGWLVDFCDESQIVDAVLKVLSDPSGMRAMRRAAVESVKERFAQAAGTAGYLDGLDLKACPTAMMKPVNEISAEEI